MNIALIVHDLHEHGGHSLYTKILADELSQRHRVTVFANRCERPSHARWDFCYVPAWRVNALATVQTFPVGLRAWASKLAEFDIRHAQGYCGGQPNTVTAHICLAAYLNSLRDISWQSRASLRSMAVAEERFYRRFHGHVIAVSTKVARELREFYQVPGQISVVPHGVDAERFCSQTREFDRLAVRKELGIDSGQTTALYVGDLTKAHVHLKALADAAPDVQFVIVTSSGRYRWFGPNVRILPPTDRLARYYAAADAFVFPTSYDAFGMVILEAMASGLAVFTSDRAGAAEVMHSGTDGFVVPLDDWVEAAAAELRDVGSLRRIGCEAQKTARRHDWSSVIRDVEQIYFNVGHMATKVFGDGEISHGEYRYQQ